MKNQPNQQVSQIIHGDCIKTLHTRPEKSVDLVFADPPFNISLAGYDNYDDNLAPNAYITWTGEWLAECARVLKDNGSIYVAISDEFAGEMAIEMKKHFVMRNWLIWNYGFGQQTKKKFARCKTHILYYVKSEKGFTFNGDAIKIPSQRQLKYGDKRAAGGGKVPEDVWNVSRLCGTFNERIKDKDGSVHPCQMPQYLLERVILGSSNVGDLVLDPFCGTGTTAFVAKYLDRKFLTIDKSEKYCSVAALRIFGDEKRFETTNQTYATDS